MLSILFQDDLILAVNKPSGIPSHSLKIEDEKSVDQLLKKQCPDLNLFLLHRLDTGTSGVLLFAKNESIFNEMRNKFKLRELNKHYHAFVERNGETLSVLKSLKMPHQIDLPLAHHPKSKKRMIALPPDLHRVFRGKPIEAITKMRDFEESEFAGNLCFKLNIEIITGVMHQIRVHLASLKLPLIGDPIYGTKTDFGAVSSLGTQPIQLPRLGLHAKKVSFELQGQKYLIEAPDLNEPS